MTTYIIEGLDRLGKSTLINGIKDRLGYHLHLHRQKPEWLDLYCPPIIDPQECKKQALKKYQVECFKQDMNLIANSHYLGKQSNQNFNIIFDRSWIGEAVYAPLYRGYNGDYVFDLETQFNLASVSGLKLILLTEDFAHSKHFVDDGESFDITKREQEQQLFIDAFNKSNIKDKKIICVTDAVTGQFKSKSEILNQALE